MLLRIKQHLLRLVTICILLTSMLLGLFVITSPNALASSNATAKSNQPPQPGPTQPVPPQQCRWYWHDYYTYQAPDGTWPQFRDQTPSWHREC